jgi:hypothetical protein
MEPDREESVEGGQARPTHCLGDKQDSCVTAGGCQDQEEAE